MTRHKKIVYSVTIISIILIGVIIGIVGFFYQSSNRLITYRVNTTIANAYVGGMYVTEAREFITSNAVDWTRGAEIKLTYQGYEIPIDSKIFSIDIPTSIDSIEDGKVNRLSVSIKNDYKSNIQNLITMNQGTLRYEDFDLEKLEQDLLNKVSLLYKNITLDLGEYVINLEEHRTTIAETTIPVNQVALTNKLNSIGNTILLPGHERFSLIEWNKSLITEENQGSALENGGYFTDQELSVIATALYELILYTNFNDIEKHITEKLENFPAFAENKKGFEAFINTKEAKDLTFYNPNPMEYRVQATASVGNLEFEISGAPFIHTIEVIGMDQIGMMTPEEIIIPRTTYNGVELAPGQEIIFPGRSGFSVLIQRKITDFNRNITYESMNEDIYMPQPTIKVVNNTPAPKTN